MNKEEIEESKKCLNETIQNAYAERKAIKLDNLRKYIQHLEQKSEILDKVTDKLKEIGNKYIKEYKDVEKLELIQQDTAVLQELSCVIDDIEEILNIIEGV